MDQPSAEHRLAAILSTDAVAYSRLRADDEVETVRTVRAYGAAMAGLVARHHGRVVDLAGDNLLAEFPSAVDATRCAVEMQSTLRSHNAERAPVRRMEFRIGLHLGDVLVEEQRIYGDGVNIAARLESLADPGGICLSDLVHSQVRNKLDVGFDDLGEQRVKNIPYPVRAYRVFHESLGAAAAPPAQASALAFPLPDKPSLAVLPFVDMSGDPRQDYFGDGLTIDIMTDLVKLSGLFLIAMESSFTYKSTPVSVRELGRQLGVNHVLEGCVRRAADRVRITAQLVDARSGRRVWAERFDRTVGDLFAVQDEITEQIVTALEVKLISGEDARICRQSLRSPEARHCSYRGWEALDRDLDEARRMFAEVIRLEPKNGLGRAELALAYWLEGFGGRGPAAANALARATELSREALELGDTTGFAHLILGHVHLLARRHDDALAEADRAVQARPSCNGVYALKANFLNYAGGARDAIELALRAIRLTPVYPPLYPAILAASYQACGRYDEAVRAAQVVVERQPDNVDARLILAGANAALGRHDAARAAAQDVLRIEPAFSLAAFAQGQPYKESGQLQEVVRSLRSAGLS